MFTCTHENPLDLEAKIMPILMIGCDTLMKIGPDGILVSAKDEIGQVQVNFDKSDFMVNQVNQTFVIKGKFP